MDTINKEKDMKPRIIQRRDINKQEWDKFVMESPYGWAFHLYDVIGVDRYKEDKYMMMIKMKLHYYQCCILNIKKMGQYYTQDMVLY